MQETFPTTLAAKSLKNTERKKGAQYFTKRIRAEIGCKEGLKGLFKIDNTREYLSTPRIKLVVSRNSFNPVPKVDSALVEFIPTGNDYDEGFFSFIKTLFEFKNKSVKNALLAGRREWSQELDKRKLRDKVKGLSDKKVVSLSINELLGEYKKFRD